MSIERPAPRNTINLTGALEAIDAALAAPGRPKASSAPGFLRGIVTDVRNEIGAVTPPPPRDDNQYEKL